MSLPRTLRRFFFAVSLAATSLLPFARPASACAVLPSNDAPAPPDLEEERVLILHDKASQTEHFIREVRFAKATSRFAFLVPSPSKPEVEKVAEEPFDSLETFYPFQPPEPQSRSLEESKSVAMPTDTAVTVHEVKRIGSFTAFVLSATDAKALDQWFTENEIARPPNAVEWLGHFVDKKFFLTAFRYEPPEAAGGEIEAETVRLSFKTPDAYYPYIEPLRSDVGPNRHLAVWTVAESPLVPAALFAPKVGGVRWDHAWSEGMEYKVSRDQLARTLPGLSPLLPAPGSLVVQTFMDHRSNRNGVSDVIFANAGDDPGSPEFRARAAVLIGSLDKLLHTGAHTPDLEDSKPAVGQLYPMPLNRGCACDMAASSSTPAFSGLAALAALAAVLHGRRRRRPAS